MVSAFCLISYCILYICIPIALVISQKQIFLFSNSGTQAWMALCPHPPSSKYLCPSWDVLFSEVIVWESDDFIGHLFKESFHIYSATPDLEFSNQSHILSCSATLPNESLWCELPRRRLWARLELNDFVLSVFWKEISLTGLLKASFRCPIPPFALFYSTFLYTL